jgi:predicted Rossmann fold nucleotide-binding protein DprA/Smf involved in DNA uptake
MVRRALGKLFCEALARSGLTITSGLALGIDGVAHRAALNAQGKTIGVLGHGLFTVYPRRHISLAADIVANGGARLRIFPQDTPNPAISLDVIALSAGLVVGCWLLKLLYAAVH